MIALDVVAMALIACGTGCPDSISVMAIDGVTNVTLTDDTGARREPPVLDNGFSLEITRRPTRLTWRGPRGAESFDFPITSRISSERDDRRWRSSGSSRATRKRFAACLGAERGCVLF